MCVKKNGRGWGKGTLLRPSWMSLCFFRLPSLDHAQQLPARAQLSDRLDCLVSCLPIRGHHEKGSFVGQKKFEALRDTRSVGDHKVFAPPGGKGRLQESVFLRHFYN